MKIVNPLYDTAFKYLMDNNFLAKKLISGIIEKEIISLDVFPQETTVELKRENVSKKKKSAKKNVSEYLSIYRLDFKAIVKNADGSEQKILIEVQKSRFPDPIDRFRRYLAANYSKNETYTENGVEKTKLFPIITIYFLGYSFEEYDFPIIFVDNQVYNGDSKRKIALKNNFVKLLTHQSYIIQVKKIPAKPNSNLMRLLSFFSQSHQEENKDYVLNVESNLFNQDFVSHLNVPLESEEFARKLQLEREYSTELENYEKTKLALAEEREKLLEKDKELEIERENLRMEQEKSLQKEKEIEKQAKELQFEREKSLEKEKELQFEREKSSQVDFYFKNLVRSLLLSGKNKQEISEMTGISLNEIEKFSLN